MLKINSISIIIQVTFNKLWGLTNDWYLFRLLLYQFERKNFIFLIA